MTLKANSPEGEAKIRGRGDAQSSANAAAANSTTDAKAAGPIICFIGNARYGE
jgi:hypothetical protein